MQPVARFVIPDGDIVFIFWDDATQKTYLTSDQDHRLTKFWTRTIRDTIVWSMCEDQLEFENTPLVIEDLKRQHLESIQEGETWVEDCTPEQHAVFQWQSWAGYIANKIFLTFTVRVLDI